MKAEQLRKPIVFVVFVLISGFVILAIFGLMGSRAEQKELDVFKDDIVVLAEDLTLEDWDDDEENVDVLIDGYVGIYDDSDLMFLAGNDEVFFSFSLSFDETDNPTETLVWNVMIKYINLETGEQLFLDYYVYDEWVREDLDNESFSYTLPKIIENLENFTLDDYEDILIDLGFEDYL
jgi:hypothetical protein